MSEPVRRLELFTGAGRRRTWSQDEKAAIVSESAASTISISAVARRHGLNVSQLFTWRRLARQEAAGDRRSELRFVPAVLMSEPLEPTPVEAKAEPHRQAACTGIEVEVGGVLVRVGPDAGEAQIAAVIRALKATA
ncbi:transposase [Methylobacterium sp. WL103]|uniref:IS66-like element accessory protein TnpA n=1 Tax=Methylobacterium sp. WL103 TaxID=2603891 RepID=UPI001FEFE52D|nr:transposase [Methylobacterium sp. WL103]